MRSSRGRASLTSARCGTSRPASSWKETSRERVNCLADHLHPQCLCRRRGDLQGVLDAAHAVDVGRERDPRDHPARRDPGHRVRRVQPRARGGPGRGGAGEREHGRRVLGDRPNAADVCPQEETRAGEGRAWRGSVMTATPVWAQLVYLLAAVCFILALKGLSSPKTARAGNLIGAVGAVIACVVVFFYAELDHVAAILVAAAIGTLFGVVGARRVQMTQMPQLVALFNGVGGGAAALVALLELGEIVGGEPGHGGFALAATAFTIVVGSVSFSGSLVTFAKLQDLMTSRPVTFPGLPILFGGSLLVALVLSGMTVVDAAVWVGVVLALVGLALGVLLVLPVGRGVRYLPHEADGRCDGPLGRQHPVRRSEGRFDARCRGGLGPAGAVRRPAGCGDPARLREQGDHRPRLRTRRRAGPAHPAGTRGRARGAGDRGGLRDPSRRGPDARPHERVARRGAGAL